MLMKLFFSLQNVSLRVSTEYYDCEIISGADTYFNHTN